jgi:predicted outer membrane repeat protein
MPTPHRAVAATTALFIAILTPSVASAASAQDPQTGAVQTGAASINTVQVRTEQELRAAFSDPATTSIELLNDIDLTQCDTESGDGDFKRPAENSAPVTVDGKGFTVKRNCASGNARSGLATQVTVTKRVLTPATPQQFEVTYIVKNTGNVEFNETGDIAFYDRGPYGDDTTLVSTEVPAGLTCTESPDPFFPAQSMKCTLPNTFAPGEEKTFTAVLSVNSTSFSNTIWPTIYNNERQISNTPIVNVFNISNAISNPGPFTAVGRNGFFKIGDQSTVFPACRNGFPEPSGGCPEMEGTIDSLGRMNVSSITFPSATFEPITGIQVQASLDVDIDNGYFYDPTEFNGTATLKISHPTLIPATCAVGPFPVKLTSTQNGTFLGADYNETTGKARIGDGFFSVPAASNTGPRSCGGVASTINSFVGLPSPTQNIISTDWEFSPIFDYDFRVGAAAETTEEENPYNKIFRSRVFSSYSTEKVTFKDVTISKGFLISEGGEPEIEEFGGAVFSSGDLDFVNAAITESEALRGGAAYSEGQITATNSTFSNNEATEGAGGALFAEGGVEILGSAFSGNVSAYGGGAAAFNGTSNITDTTFTGNKAYAFGGALLATGGVPEGELTPAAAEQPEVKITGSAFSNNSTVVQNGGYGGGAYLSRVRGIIDATTFTGNSTSDLGGAVFVLGADGATGSDPDAPQESPLSVYQSEFTGNTATGGTAPGGGAVSAPELYVETSEFTGNETDGSGGAIYSETLNVTGTTFTGNESGLDGGAVASTKTSRFVTTTFDTNTAGTGGGAVSQDGTSVTVLDSIISNNRALGGFGGGVRAHSTAEADVQSSTILNNSAAQQGGGISANNGIYLGLSTVSGNSSNAGGGVSANVSLSVDRSTLNANTATTFGGGVFGATVNGEPLYVTRSTISGNSAASGGGLAATSNSGLTMTNSTVTDNTATGFGGGVFGGGESSAGEFKLSFVTIVNNSAPQGGNLAASVPTTFDATVISNPAENPSCSFPEGSTVDGAYSFTSDASCGLPAGGGNKTNQGEAPLGNLQDNGGPTQTRLPAKDSALTNVISTEACGNLDGFEADQRGVTRPQEEFCDIGAVEGAAPAPPPPPPPPPGPDPVCTVGPSGQPLTSFSSSGPGELEATLSRTPLILGFTHSGDGAFKVIAFNAAREQVGVLIDTTGDYSGTLPIQFGSATPGIPANTYIKYLTVEASPGTPWEAKVWALDAAPQIAGREFTGGCDAVVTFSELQGAGRNVTVRTSDTGPFTATAYSTDTLVRVPLAEVSSGPHEQTTLLPDPYPVVAFKSTGTYSVGISTPSGSGTGITEVQQPRFTG